MIGEAEALQIEREVFIGDPAACRDADGGHGTDVQEPSNAPFAAGAR
jgi:hypothetical protein